MNFSNFESSPSLSIDERMQKQKSFLPKKEAFIREHKLVKLHHSYYMTTECYYDAANDVIWDYEPSTGKFQPSHYDHQLRKLNNMPLREYEYVHLQ